MLKLQETQQQDVTRAAWWWEDPAVHTLRVRPKALLDLGIKYARSADDLRKVPLGLVG